MRVYGPLQFTVMSLPHYHPAFQPPREIEHKENPLSISWHDSAWIPILSPGNVMDYFTERSNPFYDRTCNNEIIKMQRLSSEQLSNMTGLEYILLHVQEPILYVIRKQHRHSQNQVTPLADYYILAGIIYQAPDMCSVLNSRLLTTLNHLQTAFEEAISFSRYHPSKGYWWEFKDNENQEKPKPKDKAKEEPSSHFQRRRVDVLLGELFKKFPYKMPSPPQLEKQTSNEEVQTKVEPVVKLEIKQEPPSSSGTANNAVTPGTTTTNATSENQARNTMKPPPEKRPRLMT